MLIFVVFTFSVIYYYLQLFQDNNALYGIFEIKLPQYHSHRIAEIVTKIAVVPSFDTIVDCFYYSITTISTLGFGDIRPLSASAKVVTCFEVMAGFLLVVISIGSVIGNSSYDSKSGKETNKEK